MIISYGTEEYIDNKKKLVRYNFFKDEIDGGKTRSSASTSR
jgi:serine protein kinase